MKSPAFRDQVVIVTGTSAGIGKALALQLASQGARMAIVCRAFFLPGRKQAMELLNLQPG